MFQAWFLTVVTNCSIKPAHVACSGCDRRTVEIWIHTNWSKRVHRNRLWRIIRWQWL